MKPVIIKTISDMQAITRKLDVLIGFVPTMGFLHEGHLSLVRKAKEMCDLVVVSIFVNPAQFGPAEDLDSYPRDFDNDYDLLSDLEVDYIFFPDKKEMYPKDFSSWVEVEGLTEVLCGASRPGHFKGVTTVVFKLVNIIHPDFMYMGEKDYQQIAVLKRMLLDLNSETVITPCPIVREEDGLALSSRNKYLNARQRQDALCLSKAIKLARQRVREGCRNVDNILPELIQLITGHQGRIDYLEFRQGDDFSVTQNIDSKTRLFLAVYIGSTRLIDNAAVCRV
jgi:pantoate--beta-alanine ligase